MSNPNYNGNSSPTRSPGKKNVVVGSNASSSPNERSNLWEDSPKGSSYDYGYDTNSPPGAPLMPNFLSSRSSVDRETTHNDPELQDILRNSRLTGSTRVKAKLDQIQSERAMARRKSSMASEGEESKASLISSALAKTPVVRKSVYYLSHVRDNFFTDARNLSAGTIPQSVVLSFVIGILCGVTAFLYYKILFFLLDLLWHVIPNRIITEHWPEQHWVWYIPLLTLTLCFLVGVTVVVLGEPGDLPFTISCIHSKAYIPMDHVAPMLVASLFSILAGGSLGPEAPLVAICGALGGWVSRYIFGQHIRNVVRKHSLMGMAGALAAFFGCPLGGSLFALEVNSRFGVEYFEHMVEAIFCGEITLVVFRSLSGLPIRPIWDLDTATANGSVLTEALPWHVLVGGLIGLLGAAASYLFATFHWANMGFFDSLGLLDNKYAIPRALLGGFFVVVLGVIAPHTMFWGEEEFQIVATMSPASELPNVWPTSGALGYEIVGSVWRILLLGFLKMGAISFTVAAGLRGGYIFPLMCSGAALGRALFEVIPEGTVPLQICVLCMAAGINVAITRTSLASTLILTMLTGEAAALPAILAASLCSLFATAYVPFIKTQIARSDIDHSLFHEPRTTSSVAGMDESWAEDLDFIE